MKNYGIRRHTGAESAYLRRHIAAHGDGFDRLYAVGIQLEHRRRKRGGGDSPQADTLPYFGYGGQFGMSSAVQEDKGSSGQANGGSEACDSPPARAEVPVQWSAVVTRRVSDGIRAFEDHNTVVKPVFFTNHTRVYSGAVFVFSCSDHRHEHIVVAPEIGRSRIYLY